MMQYDDIRIIWRIIVARIRVKRCYGGYVKATGEGVYTSLSTQIHKEESRKTFSTSIVSYFAGTFDGVGFYVLAKLIRVVLTSLMLIPSKYNHYIGKLKNIPNKVCRKPHTSQPNWIIEYQLGIDGENYTIRCNCLCILSFLEVPQATAGYMKAQWLILRA